MKNIPPAVLFFDRPFAAGMAHLWLRDYFFSAGFTLHDADIPPWKQQVMSLDGPELPDYLSELDWPEMVRHTLARINGRYGYTIHTAEQQQTFINYVKQYAAKVEQQFLQLNVRAVVIFGNYRVETKIAAYFARRYQARLLCIESFFLQEYFYLEAEQRQIANHHGFIGDWPFYRNFVITEQQQQVLKQMMLNRESHGLLDGYIQLPAKNGIQHTRLDQCNGKVGLLLGQVAYDAVIVNDLQSFDSQFAFLSYVIEQFLLLSDDGDLLVCRLHPLEARYGDDTRIQLEARFGLHPRVLLLSDQQCNTYELMQRADFGVVANSQSGLEMIYRDKPVLVCANPYYAIAQFCLQAHDAETISFQLSRLLQGWQPSAVQLDKAKHYLAALVFYHLTARSKDAVYQKLDIMMLCQQQDQVSLQQQQQEYTARQLSVMPDGNIGRLHLALPAGISAEHRCLLLGVGSFGQYFAERLAQQFHQVPLYCTDLPADCQQRLQGQAVMLFKPVLLTQVDIIIVSWPLDKTQQFLRRLNTDELSDKVLYHVIKRQRAECCEFQFSLLSPSGEPLL